jgi:DNA topoisomerase-1
MRGMRGGRSSWRTRQCSLGRGYTLIIAEKPKAGAKIAEALAGPGRLTRCRYRGIPYWVLHMDGERVVVAPSAGHLYGPYTDKRGFPVYDFEWRPLWEFEKGSRHLRKFHELLAMLARNAGLYINACDYDVEGSLIGYMIIEALGDPRRAYRMKFSSLSPTEIRGAYRRLEPLDWEMVEAGRARHELDWLWGINVSRALMHAARMVTGRRVILSAGRVQTPTLAEAVRRWRERNLHVPEPRIQLRLTLEHGGVEFNAHPRGWAPESRVEASSIASSLRREGWLRVSGLQSSRKRISPPPPFNLGDLQYEAARLYGFSPMKTQNIAENLYLEALISYPRTNSQKLPPTIDYASIIRRLSGLRAGGLGSLAERLLRESGPRLQPVQGRKEDPAHPAIYPTGELPSRSLTTDEWKIYDLIVRRFLAAFSRPATIGNTVAELEDSAGRPYLARGVEVVNEGWLAYYPYLKPREQTVPSLAVGSKVRVVRVSYSVQWSRPALQLSKTSLVKWMESVGIGTEATRARIVEILFRRGYLQARGPQTIVTDLGATVADIIERLAPELASPRLTRVFEEKLEAIRSGKASRRDVLEEAIKTIDNILSEFRSNLPALAPKLAYSLGAREPPAKCPICGRESAPGAPLGLCSNHLEAARRLSAALGLIASRLNVSEEEAVRVIASRRGEAGRWVVEVARLALRDRRLLSYLTRRDKPPR